MEVSPKFGFTSDEPLGKNPFSDEDERHQGWTAMSRIARKNLMLFNSALLSRKPAMDAPPKEVDAWWAELLAGRFGIMGSAAVAAFGSTFDALPGCEKLLDHLAEFSLKQAEKVSRESVLRARSGSGRTASSNVSVRQTFQLPTS